MPEKGRELFDIMDAALKRQREGVDAVRKRQGTEGARQRPAAPPPAAPPPATPPSGSVAPVEPVRPVTPRAPVSPQTAGPAGPAQPPAAPGAAGQATSPYTERLSRVPDSARSAPAAGTLSPGEVLRGTVFSTSSRREVPSSEVLDEPVAPEGPPRPGTVRTTASGVLSRQAPSSAAITQVNSARASGVSGIPASQRAAAPAAGGETRGFFLPTELAVLGVIGMTLALVCAFYVGVRVGRQEALTGKGRPGKGGKVTPGEGGRKEGIKARDVNSIKGLDGLDTKEGPPAPKITRKPPQITPGGKGRWTVEVLRYRPGDTSAERLKGQLVGRGFSDVFLAKRRIGSRTETAVCVGHFESRNDARAIQVRDAIISLNRRRYTGVVEIVKLD